MDLSTLKIFYPAGFVSYTEKMAPDIAMVTSYI
jgi:hypothetical protein